MEINGRVVITLEQLNAAGPAEWVTALGGIFEHSPWVAQRALGARPYQSRLQLLDAMRAAVEQATLPEQLALIRAHPKLGLRGRAADGLTPASAREQRRAGLAACTPAQLARLEQLNALYQEKSGFPFILAVRGHDPASIIANMERRITNDSEIERRTALSQIGTIAAYRLADLVSSPPGPEILAMLERLARAEQAHAATALDSMVREWMQAAGLELCTPAGSTFTGDYLTGGYLVGRTDGGDSNAKTLLVGACLDSRSDTLHYQGRAAFVAAIQAAHELRHHSVRPACGLMVLARPKDRRLGNFGDHGGLYDDAEPESWVELPTIDAVRAAVNADAETVELMQALRSAGLDDAADGAKMLVRRADAGGGQGALGQGAAGASTAVAAERAVRALQKILGQVATAA
jgi:OHCU decarboxylase